MTVLALETISGLVERISPKGTGIKVAGEWLNVSQYHALAELPKLGQRVGVQVQRSDRGLWINRLEVLDDGKIHELPAQPRSARPSGQPRSEPRDIRRQSALRSAVMFAAARQDMKSQDVLVVADRFLTWLERGGAE